VSAQLPLEFISAPTWRSVARQEHVLLRVCQNAERFRYITVDWMRANWKVWLAFEHEADARAAEGHRAWGARTIGEFIRRQTRIAERDGEFKVNDHIWPDLARLYMIMKPEREGFFDLRGRNS
jgi:hypothetical protein